MIGAAREKWFLAALEVTHIEFALSKSIAAPNKSDTRMELQLWTTHDWEIFCPRVSLDFSRLGASLDYVNGVGDFISPLIGSEWSSKWESRRL